MSAALVAVGLALVAGVPLAALGWAAAAGTERLTREPRLRERAWSLALHLPLLVAAGAATVAMLPARAAGTVAAVTVEVGAVSTVASAVPEPSGLAIDWAALSAWALGAALLGAVVRLLLALHGTRRAGRLVSVSQPFTDPRVLEIAASGARRLGVPAPEVRVSATVGAPLLAGLRCPVVLLPEALVREAGPQALALVCVHELAHLSRGDNRRLLVEEAVLGALWFNPFAHLVRARLRAVREEACDALALTAEPPATRRLYAETLIATLRLRAGPELQPAFTGARRRTAMRLKALLHPAGPSRIRHRLLASGALGALLFGGAGGALALADAGRDAAPRSRMGLHVTPEPTFLRRWEQASRSSGAREAVDLYTGELKLGGPAPTDYPVAVDGRPVTPGQDMGAVWPVESVQVRRTAAQPFGRAPRILKVEVRTKGTAGEGTARFGYEPRPIPVGDPAPVISRPNWTEKPSGEDLGAAYPAAARAAGLGGRATIQCRVESAGTLSGCEVVSESPAGAGFGPATLAVAPKFRMNPPSPGNAIVRIPLLWQVAQDVSQTIPESLRTVAANGGPVPAGSPNVVVVAGPNLPITVDGRRQPDGFRLDILDPRTVDKIDFKRRNGQIVSADVTTRSRPTGSATPPRAATSQFKIIANEFSSNPPGAIYIGDVRIEGDLSTAGAPVFVDGRRADPGVSLASLGRIDQVELLHEGVPGPDGQRPPLKEIRITTAR